MAVPGMAIDAQAPMTRDLWDRLETGRPLSRFGYWRKKTLWRGTIAGARSLKRALDILVPLLLLPVLLPLFAVVAALIKLTDGGPVFFWQKRVGRWGREFAFPKFRSMVTNAENLKTQLLAMNDHKSGITFKMKKDPRVTWIGRLIRKTSIDELPQLWCVFNGEMTLVGPRPPVPDEVRRYRMSERRRLEVVPGLTCLWQISGRGDLPFDKQVELDLEYIRSQSVWLDLKICLMTVPAVVLGKGAY